MKTKTASDATHARSMLLTFCPRGSTVYVVNRGVAKSGMSRLVDLYAIAPTSEGHPPFIQRLTGWACTIVPSLYWNDKAEAARIHGCGMDMHFEAVYQLATALYGDGKALTRETL